MHYQIAAILFLLCFQTQTIPSQGKSKTLIKSSENIADLDYDGKVVLGWTIDKAEKSIIFELEGETDGYVGLGISLHGTMPGSDLFVAGVFPNGSSYHSDRFVPRSESVPKIDKISNWRLLKAEEVTITSATKRGHMEVTKTYLKFTRYLDTCDEEEDLSIGKDPIKFIWALGESDEVDYHGVDERGTRTIDLYLSSEKKADIAGTPVFGLTLENVSLPENPVMALCTFYKAPDLPDKHHVVAWSTILSDGSAQSFVSHLTVYSCSVGFEESAFETFRNFTIDKFKGTSCSGDEKLEFAAPPVKFCTEVLFSWLRGNPDFYLPDDVGYAIGGQEGALYYMLETRFSNPEALDDIQLNARVNMHYVEELRSTEAGLMWMGRSTNFTLAIPPSVTDYVVAAHCSPNCTRRFPRDGVTIFSTLFRAGLSGIQVKLRHFRHAQEHAWIDTVDHHDSTYEETKQLLVPVTVLPGDQIILECTYNTMWYNGSVEFGGLEETCQGYFWYYPKIEVSLCGSSYPLEGTLQDFGLTNTPPESSPNSVNSSTPDNPVIESSAQSHTGFNWTLSLRQILESKTRFGLQDSICSTGTQKMENFSVLSKSPSISYPLISTRNRPYAPPKRECTEGRRVSMPGGQSATKRSEVNIIALLNFICFMISKYA